MHVDQIEGLVLLKAQSTIIRLSIDHRTKDFIFIINCEILKYAICQHETASCLLKTLSEIFHISKFHPFFKLSLHCLH